MEPRRKRHHSEPLPHATSSESETHIEAEEKYIRGEPPEPSQGNEVDDIHGELKKIRTFMARFIGNELQTTDSKNAELGSSRSARSRSQSPYPRLSRSPIRRLKRGRSSSVRRSVFSVSPKRRSTRFGTSNSPVRRRRRRRSSSSRSLLRPTIITYPQAQVAAQPPIPPQSQTQYYGLPGPIPRDNRILESVITDFSSIVVIATFMASVSIALLTLANNLLDNSSGQNVGLKKTLHVILQIFASLSLSFNLSVAIIAGGAASNQSARLRAGLRAKPYTEQQGLEPKLKLCSVMQYYGLLALTVATGCLFGLLLSSPFAIIMIIPVIGVVFYDSLYRGPLSSSNGADNAVLPQSYYYAQPPYASGY